MSTNFKVDDVTRGVDSTDLDDRYVTESWLIDRFTQGTLFAWGHNTDGDLGLGDTVRRSSPVQIGIQRGYDTTLQNGQLTYEWYNNTATVHPTTTAGLDAFFTTATSGVTFGGSGVYSSTINWGDGGQTGILGVVGTKPSYLPANNYSWRVFGFIRAPETGTYTFSVDGDDACDIRVNGQIVAFWYDGHGFSSQTPRPASAVGTITLQAGKVYPIEIRFEEISGGDGIVAAWQPPSGSSIVAIPPSVFVRGDVADWAVVSAGNWSSYALKSDGTLWSWGDNNPSGQLGLGDIIHRSTPVQVGSLTDWKYIAAGYVTFLGIKRDNSLWVIGGNGSGQLGLGAVLRVSSPVQIGSSMDWRSVSTGSSFSLAIKTDGTLWSTGSNFSGKLGLGDALNRSTFTQVGSTSNWKSVFAVWDSSYAITQSGELYGWGSNTGGQLGIDSALYAQVSTPVLCTSLDNCRLIRAGYSHSVAIKDNGSIWSSGFNGEGQLGLGDIVHRSSFTQIGSLLDWKTVGAGGRLSAGIKKDGTLWVWGENAVGQLGLGDTTHRSSPTQLGSKTNWKAISISTSLEQYGEHILALTYKE